MQRVSLLSMHAELCEFVLQTQIRLTTVRKLIAQTQQASLQTSINIGDSLPTYVPPHTGTLLGAAAERNVFEANPVAGSELCPVVPEIVTTSSQDAAELHSTSTATERLESIKRRLAEQIQKT